MPQGPGIEPRAAIDALQRRFGNPFGSYSWLDVWQNAHARGFTVAKSAGFDVLDDIIKALDDAQRGGQTFEQFARNLEPVLRDKGWWGRGPALDPATGTYSDAQLGSPRRLRTIYDINMRQSRAAGEWVQIQRTKDALPYLMYDCVHDAKTRAQHRLWGGADNGRPVVLRADHPWWHTHYPPNGWNCRCGVIQLSDSQVLQMRARGLITEEAPQIAWREFRNARTGEVVRVPDGIDPGFAYNAGEAMLAQIAA